MTYFDILLVFVLPPVLVLMPFALRDIWQWLFGKSPQVERYAYPVLLAHVVVALIYTTPWDNYLVATGVWWYDPKKVAGIQLGWVPIEEYLFFILQTLMTGLWVLSLRRLIPLPSYNVVPKPNLRLWTGIVVLIIFLVGMGILFFDDQSGTYLGLIFIWAIVPIFIQMVFGADILLHNHKLLFASILPPSVYLWIVDRLAIQFGTWTIDRGQTTGLKIGGLPIEEMLFFFLTNVIIAFGITLMLSRESQSRAKEILLSLRQFFRRSLGWINYQKKFGLIVVWVAILILTPLGLSALGEEKFPWLIALGVIAQLAVVLTAQSYFWSVSRLLKISGVVIIGSWSIEFLGVSSGIPFGSYQYTDKLLPFLGGVPLLVLFAWLMMLFPSWAVAESILMKYRLKLGRGYWLFFSIISGAAFTAWDFYLDPQMVSRNIWLWQQPGGYFGIPWSNFLGWWISSTLLTFLIRPLHLARFSLVLVYTLVWILQAIGLGFFWNQPGPALVGFLGMGLFVVLAWRREVKIWKASSGQ